MIYPSRQVEVQAMLESGMRPRQIAQELGISHQRVYSIVKKRGLSTLVEANRPERQPAPESKIAQRYGVPITDLRRLRRIGAVRAFIEQRRNASSRGIGWEFTLAEWWAIWERSGKWDSRGRGERDAFVMGRFGDVGPYAPWNVEICTNRENLQLAAALAAERKRAGSDKGGSQLACHKSA